MEGQDQWPVTAEDVFTGLAEWRVAHPRATLREIEETLDARLAALRARMLEDLARASRQRDVAALPVEERPVCTQCGERLAARGTKQRRLTTQHNKQITLERSYARCPRCGEGLSPPWMMLLGKSKTYEAISARAAKRDVRVCARGVSVHQSSSRCTLMATAVATCCKRTLGKVR